MTVTRILHHVLDFCYPGRCANCDGPTQEAGMICAACEIHLDRLASAPYCDCCGLPIQSHGAPCPHCLGGGVPHFERVIRLSVFDDPVKHLIHQMKYHQQWTLAEFLADRLLDTERAKAILTETEAIVPVPLHYLRQISRGYNQADVVARRLGARSRLLVVHALRRVRNTAKQSLIHAMDQRQGNVRGAFALTRYAKQLEGKHVVVVDDVMTSGATLRAVAVQLATLKPASLVAMTLAVRDRKGRAFEAI